MSHERGDENSLPSYEKGLADGRILNNQNNNLRLREYVEEEHQRILASRIVHADDRETSDYWRGVRDSNR